MFEKRNIRLGIAPIGWSNDDMPNLGFENSFDQCISEVALSGFKGTEVGNKFPKDVVQLKKSLDLRDISIASMWFSSFLCTRPYEETEKSFIESLDFLNKLGAFRINVCEVSYCLFSSEKSMFGQRKPIASSEDRKRLYEGLNRLGEIAKDRGIKLCYHHHMASIIQTVEETNDLLENTDPSLVYLCYDTGHFMFAGDDPVEAAKLFGRRIGHVHLKDIRENKMKEAIAGDYRFRGSVLEGCFTVPGDGCIDFQSVFRTLNNYQYDGWMIVEAEQDPQKANPFEYAVKAKQYIDNLLTLNTGQKA